jgi:hypothetical protein
MLVSQCGSKQSGIVVYTNGGERYARIHLDSASGIR